MAHLAHLFTRLPGHASSYVYHVPALPGHASSYICYVPALPGHACSHACYIPEPTHNSLCSPLCTYIVSQSLKPLARAYLLAYLLCLSIASQQPGHICCVPALSWSGLDTSICTPTICQCCQVGGQACLFSPATSLGSCRVYTLCVPTPSCDGLSSPVHTHTMSPELLPSGLGVPVEHSFHSLGLPHGGLSHPRAAMWPT